METKMLKALDYDLGYPTAIHFLRYLVKLLSISRDQYYNGKLICELMSISYPALKWKPSEVAIAALDILNKVSTIIPVLRQLHVNVNNENVSECKSFIGKMILTDGLIEYESVFNKYDRVYQNLKSNLKLV